MAVTQYIGSRYVPLFADPIDWSSSNTYEPLTIVIHEGNSYTSKQAVPKGIDIANESFWALTGNYNAQVEQYRRETAAAKTAADDAQEDATAAQNDINILLPKMAFSEQATVKDYIDASINNLDEVKPFVFDTVEDMKNENQRLFEGAICHTNGFYESGDGGSAWYEIASVGTANNMDVIPCGNLFAKLITGPELITAQHGATNDIADSSAILSYMITKNKPIYINSPITIRTPIRVSDNQRIAIRAHSAADQIITCYCNFMVGANLTNPNPSITNIYINMRNIYLVMGNLHQYTCFKGVVLLSSNIYNCRFYNFAYFIEGGLNYATRIIDTRFQGFSHAVFSSVTFIDGSPLDNNMDKAQEYYTEHGNFNGYSSAYNFTSKVSDEPWIERCYFSGAQTIGIVNNNHTCIFFTINDVDRDNYFINNWVEFIYYFMRPINISAVAYGFNISNNVFQYMVNLVQPASSYTNFKVNSNRFTSMNKSAWENKLGASDTDSVFAIFYSTNILNHVVFYNNYVLDVTYVLYYNGPNSNALRFKESNTFNGDYTPQTLESLFDVTYYGGSFSSGNTIIDAPFIYTEIDSIANIFYPNETSLPDLSTIAPKLHNVFACSRFYTPNAIYKIVPTGAYGTYKYIKDE